MRFYVLILFALFTLPVTGSDVYVLKKSEGVVTISKDILIYEDKTAELELSDILKKDLEGEFKKWKTDIPIFNVTWSTIWIKIKFTTQENEKWLLYWGMPSSQKANLYRIQNGKITETKTGITIPGNERILIGNNFFFDLGINKGDTATYYLSVNDVGPMRAIVRVGTIDDFFQSESVVNFWQGAYFGIMILMAMYNLFLYFTGWKKVYLYYVFYIVSTTLFIAFFTGYINYFPDWFVASYIHLPALFPSIFGFFGILFTIEFLNTKQNAPKMHRIIVIYSYLVFIPLLLSIFEQQRLSVIGIQLLGLGFAYICLTTGLKVLKQGNKAAKFYLFGFGAYLMSLMTLILNDLIGTSSEFVSQQLLLIGSAIEAVMLSFAIGDKLNNANREKQQAQLEALNNAKENEKLIREQNIELERKVKERTSEINEQKEIIEEKQKEIVDSINYAKRIQYSLLAHDELLKSNLNDHFVLFQPKDIVSGDFYWATKKGTDFYLAVCDSTGHGVPGAFMSLLNISFLNEAITEKNISEPHLILNHVRERLIQNMEGGQDGMDAILVRFKIENSKFKIQYAAANNHPVLISNGELKELPADKMPVGKGEKMDSFTSHELELKKGDLLYLFTDGYADQFGGPKGKKFKYANLSKLLLENHSSNLNFQSQILNQKFVEWKGDLEQVDDVCIIGIKF